jgi:uncharacterized UPF0160 family protein
MISIVNEEQFANCITHSGTMHADEVFSTAFLDMYLGDVKVYRTNYINYDKVQENTLIYDVGRGKYDHHQPDAEKRENDITYCSFGLIWREFGKDFLKKYDIEYIDEVWSGIDKDLVEYIDADDNGQFPKIEAPYKVKTLPGIIKIFNPSYDSGEDESEQFLLACNLAKMILKEEILYINGKVMAEKSLIEELKDITDEKYVILDKFLPYEDTILGDEKYNNLLFVAYPSNRGGYAIKVIPKSLEDKTPRQSFPEEWAGLEGEKLEQISGIEGLTFCHTARFIVSCKDIDSVYKVFDKIIS